MPEVPVLFHYNSDKPKESMDFFQKMFDLAVVRHPGGAGIAVGRRG
jgi:hypothetical protein